jgi:dihydroorotate dehydrogenase (NAD+) catalytic subunit
MTADMSVHVGPLLMPGPVGLASGTFGYGSEYESLVDLDSLGALYTKAVTLEPRKGNPVPRIVETSSGMLNSIGLANPGVDYFIHEKVPFLRSLRCSVIVNVAGSKEEDYRKVIEKIESALPAFTDSSGKGALPYLPEGRTPASPRSGVDAYEINVSCPNVCHGGMAFGTDPFQVERLTATLRKCTHRALIVKLTPNVADIASIARAAEAGGADAVSCINTLVGMSIDTRTMRSRIAMGTGGLSGPAILPVGIACVYKVAHSVSIPVIGLGGIMEADDAIQYLLAGAVAVQVGTGTFVDPGTAGRVSAGIQKWMEEHAVPDTASISGLFRP